MLTLKTAAPTADTAVVSLVPHGDGAAADQDFQTASSSPPVTHDTGWQVRRLMGGAALLLAAAVTGLLAFSLWEVAANPPNWYGGGDKYSYGFQFAGAVAFLVPVALMAACFALAGVALVHATPRLTRLGQRSVLAGWLPALVTVTGVAVADQLLGTPTTITTWVGAGLGIVAFAAIWSGAGRVMGPLSGQG